MKKKLLIIISISAVALALLIGIVLWFVIPAANIHFTIMNMDEINYNNYTNSSYQSNNLDYRDDKLAWSESVFWSDKLTVWDQNGQSNVFWDCGTVFQLLNDTVVYTKNDNLYIRDSTGEAIKIAQNIDSFMAHESGVLYTVAVDGTLAAKLYWYDWDNQKATLIHDSIRNFCVANDKLVILDTDDQLTMYTQDECVKNAYAELTRAPFTFQLTGNQTVYAKNDNELELVDLYTGNTRSVVIHESCRFAKTAFICDDQSIFVSVQSIRYDGSIVTEVSSEGNGVWFINPETLEKKKICDRYFSRLYLFNGDILLGIDDTHGDVYQISLEDGKVSKLMD